MKRKNGFTLIELLAVIIILAVIALIATPIVLNVVDNAKRKANRDSVYGLLDGAKLYHTESLIDGKNTDGITNLLDEIKVSGEKPDSGELYINLDGEIALAVVYDKVCYTKNFSDNDLKESEDLENCSIEINVEATVYGDVNLDGKVNINDAVMIEKYLSGSEVLNKQQLANADVNLDGVVDVTDSSRIKDYLSGSDVTLGK